MGVPFFGCKTRPLESVKQSRAVGENRGKSFRESPMALGDVLVRDYLTLSNGLRQGYTLQNGTPISLSKGLRKNDFTFLHPIFRSSSAAPQL